MANSTRSIKIAFTQHCGSIPSQQDALWNGAKVFQQRNLLCREITVESGRQFFAVADGVASSPMPQRASRLVLDVLTAEIAGGAVLDGRLIRRVHGRLCDVLAKGRSFGASTTLVAAECIGDRCLVLNAGDSRAYRIAADGEWRQLSHDHTVLNAMIDSGEADAGKEYASFYSMRDSCLVADDGETDFSIARADASFLVGDAILLCSDGVHDTLGDSKLRHLTDPCLSVLEQVKVWRKAVLAAGAPDNFSMVLAKRY
jgi:serine/threonine protein phosphatase PrpC